MWPFSAIRDARRDAEFWKAQYEEWHALAWKVSQYAPQPTCKNCGGTDLFPDQAGYYRDAERWDGAPLVCVGACKK